MKEGETTLEFLAETVFGLLDHLRVAGEVTIVGHGMGCLVALKAAEMFGERVGGLVLLSPVYPSKELEEILEQRIMTAWMGVYPPRTDWQVLTRHRWDGGNGEHNS